MKESVMARRCCGVAVSFGLLCLMVSGARAAEEPTTQSGPIPPVVARVNGVDITADQYRDLWHLVHQTRIRTNREAAMKPGYVESVNNEVIDRLIALELLSQKADEMGLQPDQMTVEQQLQDLKDRMGAGIGSVFGVPEPDWDRYRADITTSLKIERLLKKEVYDKVSVQPEEARLYYEAHPKQFTVQEEVRARHILIATAEGSDEAQQKEALAAIQKAAERVRSGEPFEDVARDLSQDGSAASGGDLGYFGRGQMVPEFEEVAFSLDKGQVSDVVKTPLGYHLIKIEDRRPERVLPFEDVEAGIRAYLRKTKANALGEEYIERLKAGAKIDKIPF
jgi:peptidyl-prolyl cis-trans isomerase C